MEDLILAYEGPYTGHWHPQAVSAHLAMRGVLKLYDLSNDREFRWNPLPPEELQAVQIYHTEGRTIQYEARDAVVRVWIAGGEVPSKLEEVIRRLDPEAKIPTDRFEPISASST